MSSSDARKLEDQIRIAYKTSLSHTEKECREEVVTLLELAFVEIRKDCLVGAIASLSIDGSQYDRKALEKVILGVR